MEISISEFQEFELPVLRELRIIAQKFERLPKNSALCP